MENWLRIHNRCLSRTSRNVRFCAEAFQTIYRLSSMKEIDANGAIAHREEERRKWNPTGNGSMLIHRGSQ
jgi:hypothetical protein